MAMKAVKALQKKTFGFTAVVTVQVNKEIEAETLADAVEKASQIGWDDVTAVNGELYEASPVEITSIWKA